MESEEAREKPLSMFFDPDFDPINYVNVLFQSLTNNGSMQHGQLYSMKNLNEITNKCSSLITRFDYYTNELSQDLNRKLEVLDKSNISVLTMDESGKNTDSDYNTSRLQYYVNVLNNSILSLQTEVKNIYNDSNFNSSDNAITLDKLMKFKLVKKNLLKVIKSLEIIQNLLHSQSEASSISTEDFQKSIDKLNETILKSIENKEKNEILLEHIEELIDLLPMFNEFTNFYPIYSKFTNKLKSYRDRI